MSEHSDARAVGDRLHIRAGHSWIACVVERNEFDRPSVHAALGVHLVDRKLRRDQTFRPKRSRRTGERTGEGDANRLRAGPEGGPGDAMSTTAPMTPAAITPERDFGPNWPLTTTYSQKTLV